MRSNVRALCRADPLVCSPQIRGNFLDLDPNLLSMGRIFLLAGIAISLLFGQSHEEHLRWGNAECIP